MYLTLLELLSGESIEMRRILARLKLGEDVVQCRCDAFLSSSLKEKAEKTKECKV
jgi:hypothetical protein